MTRRSILFAGLAALAGCGGPAAAPRVSMYEVKGKVTVNGRPADRLTMIFTPVEPDKGRDDVCGVSKGEYANKLIAGRYKVSFEPAAGGTSIPKKYRSPASTDLELDATKEATANFDLK
jgi:hypothetical protein